MIDPLARLILVIAMLAAAGCNTIPVADDVDQRQAHEIVAALNSQGISAVAEKGAGARAKYAVEVKRSSYSQAVAIMNELGLPSETQASFSELVAQRGLVPNSREVEALRLDHALATEIQETLQRNPAVGSAGVIVRHNFSQGQGPAEPKVSVVVQTKPNQTVSSDEVVNLIANSVPGIARENVYVSIHELPAAGMISGIEGAVNRKGRVVQIPLVPFLMVWSVPDGDYNTLVVALLLVVLVMAGVGILVGYWYAYHQVSKTFVEEQRLPDVVPRPPLGERPQSEMTEM